MGAPGLWPGRALSPLPACGLQPLAARTIPLGSVPGGGNRATKADERPVAGPGGSCHGGSSPRLYQEGEPGQHARRDPPGSLDATMQISCRYPAYDAHTMHNTIQLCTKAHITLTFISPLALSLALEAALGRDLRQVQKAITAAKAGLASTSDSAVLLQKKLEAAIGPEPTTAQDVLGRPEIAQVLERRSKTKFRAPNPDEILLASKKW